MKKGRVAFGSSEILPDKQIEALSKTLQVALGNQMSASGITTGSA
jgi:hypothetical protein